jgi:hypothetical protein
MSASKSGAPAAKAAPAWFRAEVLKAATAAAGGKWSVGPLRAPEEDAAEKIEEQIEEPTIEEPTIEEPTIEEEMCTKEQIDLWLAEIAQREEKRTRRAYLTPEERMTLELADNVAEINKANELFDEAERIAKLEEEQEQSKKRSGEASSSSAGPNNGKTTEDDMDVDTAKYTDAQLDEKLQASLDRTDNPVLAALQGVWSDDEEEGWIISEKPGGWKAPKSKKRRR